MHTCIPRRVNAGNINTPSLHHPRRRNVTTSMVGLKKRSHTQISHPKLCSPETLSQPVPTLIPKHQVESAILPIFKSRIRLGLVKMPGSSAFAPPQGRQAAIVFLGFFFTCSERDVISSDIWPGRCSCLTVDPLCNL